MQLCLQAQAAESLGGLDGRAVYLNCEGPFPIIRLRELAEQRSSDLGISAERLLGDVLVEQIENAEHLWDVLTVTLPGVLRRGGTKLVVVDSIAALCRGEFANSASEMNERAQILLSLAAYMKQLSERYETTFIVVNQVSALFHDRKMSCASMGASFLPNGQEPPRDRTVPLPQVVPALGLTWTTCLTTRLMLTRRNGCRFDGETRNGGGELRVLLSPGIECGRVARYDVVRRGVAGVHADQ